MTITAENFRPLFSAPKKLQPSLVGKSKSDPFKILKTAQILRLCRELPASALKVWLYHYGRSGPGDTSFALVDTIALGTNQSIDTVKKARKLLRRECWLITVGTERLGNRGRMPVEWAVFPGESRHQADFPPSVERRQKAEKQAGKKPPTEVDSENLKSTPPYPPAGAVGEPTAQQFLETVQISFCRELIEVTFHDRTQRSLFRRFWTSTKRETFVGSRAFEVVARFNSIGLDARIMPAVAPSRPCAEVVARG